MDLPSLLTIMAPIRSARSRSESSSAVTSDVTVFTAEPLTRSMSATFMITRPREKSHSTDSPQMTRDQRER